MPPIDIRPAVPTVPVGLLRASERDEREVRSGPWSLRLSEGRLDDLRWGAARILRGVRFVVRDRDWSTFETSRVEFTRDGESLIVEGESAGVAGRVEWTLRVGFEEAALSVALEARVTTSFLRNRLGLIVLHGPECAGRPLTTLHPGARSESTRFPDRIAPHQPARDLVGLEWTADGVPVSLALAGDVFEMEDQRNWTDASFKTYSTPLSLPFPVEVVAGDVVRQSLRVECSGAAPATVDAASSLRADAADERHPLPEIRTCASSAPGSARPAVGSTLGLLVECDVRWAGWRRALRRALDDSRGRPVDLRIVAVDPADVDTVLTEAGTAPLARIGVFSASGHCSDPVLVGRALRATAERGIEIVGGARSHFTEVNRGAEALAQVDAPLAFSITPFMHDRSGHQLVESLGVQRTLVRDAAVLAGERRLHIGPITLGARMNAVATSPFDPGDPDVDHSGYGPELVADATDSRQTAPALAAWVVGSLAALSAPSVDSLTFFEEWGPRGIRTDDGPTAAGRVLEWAAELAGSTRLHVDAPGLAAIGGVHLDRRIVLLGNVGGEPVRVAGDGILDWQRAIDGSSTAERVLLPGDAARIELAPEATSAPAQASR